MKTKIKIVKSENVYFDGKYVCNGMWLAKKEYVEIVKELQVLIDSNIKFS